MLDLPDVVVAEPVGELDLVEGVGEQPLLVDLESLRARHLVLVEEAEPHAPRGYPGPGPGRARPG